MSKQETPIEREVPNIVIYLYHTATSGSRCESIAGNHVEPAYRLFSLRPKQNAGALPKRATPAAKTKKSLNQAAQGKDSG